MVEIARAVSENAKVLVLDEPTAALSRAETLQLYRLIEQMRQDGVGMVYISHRMEEVWQLANRVTVFRDGTWIGTEILGNVSTTDIVRMMVGRQIVDLSARAAYARQGTAGSQGSGRQCDRPGLL
jgi:ribose transport system ATP-binding protein